MKPKQKRILIVVALVVLTIGLCVIVDWCFFQGSYNSIQPDWVTEKFTTAVISIIASTSVLCKLKDRDRIAELCAFLGMTLVFATLLIGPAVVIESDDAVRSTRPGMPSLGTFAGFALLFGGILVGPFARRLALSVFSISSFIGGLAVFGYILNRPLMYFEMENSTAMALLTALKCGTLGVVMFLFKWKKAE